MGIAVVADVGAGSGRLSFLLAKHAKTVYAIEPLSSFRSFIRDKAKMKNKTIIPCCDRTASGINSVSDFFTNLFPHQALWSENENQYQNRKSDNIFVGRGEKM